MSTTDEENDISSVSGSPGTGAARGDSFLSKDWRDIPDGLLHALASTLDSAATEMEVTCVVIIIFQTHVPQFSFPVLFFL